MKTQAIIVFITAPSTEVAQQVADVLLSQKLAACVNLISPINSLYFWKGEACNDQEVLLVVKTRADLFEDRLVPAVQAVHPYEVPEIIALPVIMGAKSYLDWIEQETAS